LTDGVFAKTEIVSAGFAVFLLMKTNLSRNHASKKKRPAFFRKETVRGEKLRRNFFVSKGGAEAGADGMTALAEPLASK